MIVMKFGGSSVASAKRIKAVSEIIKNHLAAKPIVVSSALGKTTDLLIEAGANALKGSAEVLAISKHHQEVCSELAVDFSCLDDLLSELTELLNGIKQIKEISPRTSDYLVSFGERMAVRVIAAYLSKIDIPAKSFDAWNIGMETKGDFQNSEITKNTYDKINQSFSDLKDNYTHTPIVTGFIGKNQNDEITTFGRGGSDLTATIIGAAIKADEIQIWKDVDGLMTADPRKVKEALPVTHVSYNQATELAYFGANILHPLSMKPASAAKIPVVIRNSYSPEAKGTRITEKNDFSDGLIKSISKKSKITLIDICSAKSLGAYGFLAKVFAIFEKHKIIVDVLASSEVSISLTVPSEEVPKAAITELEAIARISVKPKHSIISLVCDASKSNEILGRVYTDLAKNKLNPKMISQGASKLNISLVFEEAESDAALNTTHQTLISLR